MNVTNVGLCGECSKEKVVRYDYAIEKHICQECDKEIGSDSIFVD